MADSTSNPNASSFRLEVAPSVLFRDGLHETAEGEIYIEGHRITLQDVVGRYTEGDSPEQIAAFFPTVKLSKIHRVIAFYIENRTAIDAYVARDRQVTTQQRADGNRGIPLAELRARLAGRRAG